MTGADKIDAGCTWELGRDEQVMVTIQFNEDDPQTFKFVGLSREEAKLLAAQLLGAVEACEDLDRVCEEHDAAVEREEDKVRRAEAMGNQAQANKEV